MESCEKGHKLHFEAMKENLKVKKPFNENVVLFSNEKAKFERMGHFTKSYSKGYLY